jgi:hypothetical protein
MTETEEPVCIKLSTEVDLTMVEEPNAENVLPMRVKEETDRREKDAKNSETKQWLKKMNSIVSEARLVNSEQSEARTSKAKRSECVQSGRSELQFEIRATTDRKIHGDRRATG